MSERFVLVPARDLAPYVEGLRALERDIEYPIQDGQDSFRIDHGAEYHPFFSALGDAYFLVALDGERVVGSLAGMAREAIMQGEARPATYLADIKVARDRRGRGLPRRMIQWAFLQMLRDPEMRRWRYAYLAAMRGARGDVMRTVRGMHPGRLVSPAATLALYFVAPEALAALSTSNAPPPPPRGTGIDLSPASPRGARDEDPLGIVSTAGRKDLRLRSTGEHWPLFHLSRSPEQWGTSWGAYLASCGRSLCAANAPGARKDAQGAGESKGVACFGIDARMTDHVAWLSKQKMDPGAICTVYAISLTRRSRGAKWLHLATSEI
jgi:GNAT superfamily N-acetyltransferase